MFEIFSIKIWHCLVNLADEVLFRVSIKIVQEFTISLNFLFYFINKVLIISFVFWHNLSALINHLDCTKSNLNHLFKHHWLQAHQKLVFLRELSFHSNKIINFELQNPASRKSFSTEMMLHVRIFVVYIVEQINGTNYISLKDVEIIKTTTPPWQTIG